MYMRGKKWTNERIFEKVGDRKIKSLELHNTTADDALLMNLAERGSLTSLDLSSDYVTDDGIRALVESCALETLMLRRAPLVTDECLAAIANCSTLCELYLAGTSVTDEGIPVIAKLPDLWSLDISHTQITDVGLRRIASKQIELISFDECEITGAGFSSWSVTDKMSFYTVGSQLDDEGFAIACHAFPFLWNIIIEKTNVTSNGLRALAGQKTNTLRIHGSPIDRDGVLWVLENLPIEMVEADPSQFSVEEANHYRREDLDILVYEKEDEE